MAMIMTPRITTSDCGSENLLKSRCLKLTAKNCLAIGLHRVSPVISSPVTSNTSSSSSSSTSPTSSLSVASDHHPSQSPPPPLPVSTCEGDNISELNALSLQSPTPSLTSPQSDRRSELVKSPQPSLENGHHQLEPIEHRQSFSSMGTDTTTTTTSTRDCLCGQAFNTADLFTDFLRENLPLLNSYFCSQLLPPPSSSNASPSKLDLVGFIYPSTLLVGGHQDALHLLSALWSRRILRAPAGYAIRFIGYTSSSLEVTTISQAQFTPLAEALHRVVDELNHSLNVEATFEAVVRQLKREFPGMELPSDELLRGSLSGLVAEHKLAFDASRGLYSATRPLLTPHWDELEQLTLITSSEGNHHHHFKGGPEEEIEIELKSGGNGGEATAENLVNRCATSTTMEATSEYFHHLKSTGNSSKSATFSSAGNSSDGTPLEQYIRLENGDQKDDGGNKLYRRSSISLSNNDIGQQQADSNSNFELSKKGATNFKRSKSLRITSKRSTLENGGQQQQQLPKDCTCSSEIIIKRQSLFSKILKFGQNSSNGSGNHLKSRSSSACSVKSTHFGSQFPEVTTTTEMLNDTEQQQETMTTKTVELTSVATQTVKCGSEDMVTLILKQAGRHALARSRSCGGGGQRSVERYANENRCVCSAKHHHNNYRESSRNGRRSNGSNRGYHTKYYFIGENENSTTQTTELTEMSLKCQCNLAEHLSFADSIVSNDSYHGRHNHHHQQQNHNHNHQRSHHRKLRSASLRASQQHQHHQQHYRPNEWLIDYNSGNGNNNHNHSHQNNTTRKGVERTRAQRQMQRRNGHRGQRYYSSQQSEDEDEDEEEEEEDEVEHRKQQQHHNGDSSHSQTVLYPKINGHWMTTDNGGQLQQQQQYWPLTNDGEERHNSSHRNGGKSNTTTTNLLINNSLNLKIEIETSSSRMPQQQQPSSTVSNGAGAHPQNHHHLQQQQHLSSSESSSQQASAAAVTFSRQLLQQAKILEQSGTSGHYNGQQQQQLQHLQQNQHQQQQPYHHQFANDIYSELTFDRHTHRLSQIQSVQGKQRQSLAAAPTPPNHQFRPLPVPPSLPTSPPPPFSASLDYTNGSSGYNSDLNYSNSITALKEQIARAKANFFSVPPLPSNGTLANSAATTTTSTR